MAEAESNKPLKMASAPGEQDIVDFLKENIFLFFFCI